MNFLGLPSVALPTHVAEGLPSGVQIVAPMHDDDAVLILAELIQGELGSILGHLQDPYRMVS
ncbi:hypothetical protein [Sulfitobacter aestuariivivens]|uniref:hypothetical protein n=1 Tax=Sulfitobacter aestuariivivens TaxID=2766981 RepID=UPI00360E6197